MLTYLKLSRSTFYYVLTTIERPNPDEELRMEIQKEFENSKCRYGYRRITLIINRSRKDKINHKKIKRLMKEMGLFAKQGKKGKYHSYKGDNGEFKRNLLLDKILDEKGEVKEYKRNFTTTHPNEKWTTDVSEFKHRDGKLYLSPILDMYDGSIIAYNLSRHPDMNQISDMLNKAFEQYPILDGLIFHSDQGWQYQQKFYQNKLKERNIKQSFSRKGNCMDNSLMENFFGILKNEMFYGYEDTFETIDDLQKAIGDYIVWYNEERINVKRKGLSPLQFRKASFSQIYC